MSNYPDNRRINRSLTNAEYQFQRRLNQSPTYRKYPPLSDALIKDCPDIEAGRPSFTHVEYEEILTQFAPKVDQINEGLDPLEEIRLAGYEEIAGETNVDINLTPEQLESIVSWFENAANETFLRRIGRKTAKEWRRFKARLKM